MAFDIKATTSGMLNAVKEAVGSEWARIRHCVGKALDEEQAFLEVLAKARLDGEIDDDNLAAQLAEETETLKAVLAVCEVMTAKALHDAASAAIDTFEKAVKATLGKARSGKARTRAPKRAPSLAGRKLNVRPDTLDFRDLMYVPTLVEVGCSISLDHYRKTGVPVLDQGQEGACTGYGLAAVAHYLLRTREIVPDRTEVSPWMLYMLARRYDEWPGERYDGSSCRGAMKGWHKHGVCSGGLWKRDPRVPNHALTEARSSDAQKRPLGAYFRVNHKDLVAMHAAICEVGVLYSSACVHSGWDKVKRDGIIPFEEKMEGGHAFAIVAYDQKGFWIQNSWGRSWGLDGFGRISYEDWLRNGTDVWVARLGVPIELPARSRGNASAFATSSRARMYTYDEIRPHVVSIGNDGQPRSNGNIATPPQQIRKILREDFPRITSGWKKRRIVLYAHGGLVSEDAAVQRVADYRRTMLESECYPLAFVWHSDYWTTLTNMLEDALKLRRPEGFLDAAKDFMLDRLDDALEPIARKLTGKAGWDEMKENAVLATASPTGAARLVLEELAELAAADPKLEIHVVGHSAGSILHGPLVRMLTASGPIPSALLDGGQVQGLGLQVASCTLWAPACTMTLFEQSYLPAIRQKTISRFAVYTLTDDAEQDDNCANIYHKSLLYLVSNAFERRARIPLVRPVGEPLLGMAKFVEQSAEIRKLIASGQIDWIQAPNDKGPGDPGGSAASHHGDFDDDVATVSSTLARVLTTAGAGRAAGKSLSFKPGASRSRDIRAQLNLATG